MKKRYLSDIIEEIALERGKMAFVSGPRQCGKTTLAKQLLKRDQSQHYYNWDEVTFRRQWTKDPNQLIEADGSLYVFDEIHKAKGWKRTLKGLYDTQKVKNQFLVTGSARLNVYKKGSDSLLGRYVNFRLHPFSLAELIHKKIPRSPDECLNVLFDSNGSHSKSLLATLKDLFHFGGFPEPFLESSDRLARIWRRGRLEKIIREDLRDLSRLPELSQVEMLASLLAPRASQLFSYQSVREDLEVAHQTVKRWMTYLKELYYCFEVKPWSKSIPRSLKKEGKLYLWDWAEVDDSGQRFENMVACHLLKACHFWTDTGYGLFELHYLRDKQKNELDFLITKDKAPWLPIEVKLSDTTVSSAFKKFLHYLNLKKGIPYCIV